MKLPSRRDSGIFYATGPFITIGCAKGTVAVDEAKDLRQPRVAVRRGLDDLLGQMPEARQDRLPDDSLACGRGELVSQHPSLSPSSRRGSSLFWPSECCE